MREEVREEECDDEEGTAESTLRAKLRCEAERQVEKPGEVGQGGAGTPQKEREVEEGTEIEQRNDEADGVNGVMVVWNELEDGCAHEKPEGVVTVGEHKPVEAAAKTPRKARGYLEVEVAVVGKEVVGPADEDCGIEGDKEKEADPKQWRVVL